MQYSAVTIWSWAPPQLLINFTRHQDRGVERSKFPFPFYFSFFSSEVSDSFSVSRSVFKLPHSYHSSLAHPPICCCCPTLPSHCVEQYRMHPHPHSQQFTHNAHDAAPFDILQSPFYPSFPDGSKVTQAPHSHSENLTSYFQQQYVPSGSSTEGGVSPPLPYHTLERPQQSHPRVDPSPPPQQHQPSPIVAYPLFPHDREGPYPMPQGLSHHLPRAPTHSARMPISPWPIDAFSDVQPTALRGGTYGPPFALRPQPLYHLPPTHCSPPTHAPPEQPQHTTTPAPSTVHEEHEDKEMTDQAQRSRSWGGVGSLDPATGVFSRASDHPRIRTAQACEKCRARKAKVSIVSLFARVVSFLTIGRLCCHLVLWRASNVPAVS